MPLALRLRNLGSLSRAKETFECLNKCWIWVCHDDVLATDCESSIFNLRGSQLRGLLCACRWGGDEHNGIPRLTVVLRQVGLTQRLQGCLASREVLLQLS
jgi:hypothetical protein